MAAKPSGCVIWVYFDEETLEMGPFLFFGGAAGEPLPSLEGMRVARHSKGNAEGFKAERPEIREVPVGRSPRRRATETERVRPRRGSAQEP